MSRSIARIALLLAVVGLGTAADAPAPAAAASRCAGLTPSKLALSRPVGKTAGILRWRAPRRAAGVTGYRVMRGGDVVGQTRKRSMRVRVRVGTRHTFRVTPLRSGAAGTHCSARRKILVRYRPPGAPRGLMAALDSSTVHLTWKASKRGDRPVSGYRVYRDGKLLGGGSGLSRDVPVASKRSYRFTVAAVDRRGRRGRMSPAVMVVTGHERPPAPTNLQAVPLSGSEIALKWAPSVAGPGRVVGYRIFRNGATVRQLAGTETTIGKLPAATTATFTVAAVDSLGALSDQSAPVTARTFDAPPVKAASSGGGGGAADEPPPTPTGLKAVTISESEIGLKWNPSVPARGRLAGYRVMRNGAVIGQFPGTETTVSNLPPSTELKFTVAAVTTGGAVSPESAPVKARTSDPQPTTGSVHAFLLASTDQSFADFRAHYRNIGTVYPTYYDCTGGGGLEGKDDPLVTSWAKARKVKVLPRINCQRTEVLTKILRDPATREQWLANLAKLVADHGYDGLQLDFEAGVPEDRDAYSAFVADLAARLHPSGRALSVAVSAKTRDIPTHARSGFYDYEALDDHADTLFVMDWGIHWATSEPGAQDDLPWATAVADYVGSLPGRKKYVLGTMLYGMDWPAGGGPSNPATAYEYGDLIERLKSVGAASTHDETADAWFATYTDADGVKHDAWYADATTVASRIRLARDRGLGGVGFWRLGREDQRMWDNPLLAPGVEW